MKKYIPVWISIALLTACQVHAPQGASVSGTLTGLSNDTLVVTSRSLSYGGINKKDTLFLQDGRFKFQVPLDTMPYQLFIGRIQHTDISQYIQLVLFPGESVTLTGSSTTDYRIEGSEFNKTLKQILDETKPYEQKLDSITQILMKLEQGKGENARIEAQKIYAESYQPIVKQLIDARITYIQQHPDSDVSLYLLAQTGSKNIRKLLPTLTDKVKNGPLASLYRAYEEDLQEIQTREANRKKITEGTVAPDFTLNNLQGEPLSLSSLRGKYVVLDFWGSWCSSCIADFPEMKKYYEKYKDKIEFLGIDCNDTEAKWKAAVEKHKLPWLHVRNEGNPDVSTLYGIPAYPTKVVIDPEGRIAKMVVGEGAAFYEYLDELFK